MRLLKSMFAFGVGGAAFSARSIDPVAKTDLLRLPTALDCRGARRLLCREGE
jgi:hypothetical protein